MAHDHKCHAEGCNISVPPKMLFCRKHWAMLPAKLKAEIWREYKPGQEIRKDPTPAYMEVQRRAVAAVAAIEGRQSSFDFDAQGSES